MGYAEFKASLKKINLKPKGVKEIVLEVSDGALAGKIDLLSELIDSRVAIQIDSEVVRYNVQINARTERPIKSYRVDDKGVVSEVKPEGEQVELELGLPKEKQQIVEVPEEIDLQIVDEFIMELLAPQFDDLPYPFYAWVTRMVEDGETYSKFARECDLTAAKVAELVDDYRSRVAPLAKAWDEWRQGNGGASAEDPREEQDPDSDGEPAEEGTADSGDADGTSEGDSNGSDIEMEDGDGESEQHTGLNGGEAESGKATEDELSDWEREVMTGNDPKANPSAEPAAAIQPAASEEDIESYILKAKPTYPDIQYDFPSLLARRKSGETWLEIARSLGKSSGTLSAAWSKYKKRVAEERGHGAA
ncbi:hypothetical protein [Cohnella sp. JJ-181]|uniref:hypothetical protein n=1 Tax=Cohnella rhizoplanae TaxID=2974897 RepID=UPI0022FFAE22|nr:hypothetical protein [Cohnella sp. JJ-181]CAI6087208.1 hypothetical protein COHCIP112018_05391 [Cohnella sp. JJ-181]